MTGVAKSFRQNRMLRQSLLVFISTTVVNAFSYAFQFVASHKLGVTNYGSLTALIAIVNVAVIPAAIATTIVAKYAAEFRATSDLSHLKHLVFVILKYAGLLALVLFALGSLLSPGIGTSLHIGDRPAMTCAFLLIALNIILPVLRAVLQGVEDFRGYAISVVIEGVGKAAFGVLAAWQGFGTAGMLAGWCVGSALSLAYSTVTLVVRYRAVPDAPMYVDLGRLARTMMSVALTTAVITSLNNTDLIIVKKVFDARTAGLYGLVALAGKTLLFLVGFVPTIVLPRAASAAASGRSPIGVLLQGTALLGLLAGGGLVGYAIAPALVIKALGGSAYLDGVNLILPYAIAMVLFALLNAVVTYKVGIHRFDFVIPLVAIGVGEVVAMSFFHDTPLHVIEIMIVGNAIGLALCLLRINAPVSVPASKSLRNESAAA